ncbi:hypothetical protein ANN_03787 [Periplaneta americana]|uniref:DUF4817 domain-containing protein n=1 Tax=Periplaneta americana TaxID=6978 RepID=A0ABQ8U4H6_PERAM|nr:hypothetical protein ANN_03787 [Periplaneta americana]
MPFVYTHQEYADIVYVYGLCDGNATAAVLAYQARFPNRRIPSAQLVQLPRFLHESLSSVRPVYVIDVYKLTPSNGPKERSRRARDPTLASDNLSAIEFRPGDFFFNVEPVIRNEATHRKIVFRVGILA